MALMLEYFKKIDKDSIEPPTMHFSRGCSGEEMVL
jgi:hypothetical protein